MTYQKIGLIIRIKTIEWIPACAGMTMQVATPDCKRQDRNDKAVSSSGFRIPDYSGRNDRQDEMTTFI